MHLNVLVSGPRLRRSRHALPGGGAHPGRPVGAAPLGRVRRLTTAAAVVAVVASAAPGLASAEGKPAPTETVPLSSLSQEVRDTLLEQAPASAAADRLRQVAEKTRGYAGLGLEDSSVVLWYKGALPREVAAAVRAEREKVAVRVVRAPHTRAQLVAAAARIAADIKAHPDSPYYGVEVAYDGSGLTVNVDASASRLATPSVESRWAVPSDVPVTLERGAPPARTGRLDDYAPFYGGGRMQSNDNSGYCTAGFSVWNGSGRYMLTAGHCGRPGGSWNNGNDTRFLGTAGREHIAHDLLLVPASVAGRIWDGGVGVNEFTKGVAGSQDAFPGEYVCTSGSTSGAVCNFRVSSSFQYSYCDRDPYGTWECYSDLVVARQMNGWPGSRPGDSGGPVFSLSGSSSTIAKGIISGVSGSDLLFQDFVTAQRDFGISVVTG